MAEVTIYTSRTCGWAVRNYAALVEKGIEFDTVPAKGDDGEKLTAFLALTPYGKTPVLTYEGTAVFESSLINEFINDQGGSTTLQQYNGGSTNEGWSILGNWTRVIGGNMMMPFTVSLPIKIMLFVLLDGWSLIGFSVAENALG